ncbi:pyrroloquinoline quinone precursor peptide PqqA [Amycolatopsis plumensis]|uniref:Coenzyme PQQ synthesis protein A n=2 Tax=Amycolatopsis TaxID=1813 RepID=A0ABV5TUQ8_9PSEU
MLVRRLCPLLGWRRSAPGEEEQAMTEEWTTPDFVEYETPMEVTAYAARMAD